MSIFQRLSNIEHVIQDLGVFDFCDLSVLGDDRVVWSYGWFQDERHLPIFIAFIFTRIIYQIDQVIEMSERSMPLDIFQLI